MQTLVYVISLTLTVYGGFCNYPYFRDEAKIHNQEMRESAREHASTPGFKPKSALPNQAPLTALAALAACSHGLTAHPGSLLAAEHIPRPTPSIL